MNRLPFATRFFCILIVLISPLAEANQNCYVPQRVTKGLRLKTTPKEYVDFYPGEELHLLSLTQKQAVISIGEIKYRLSPKDFKRRQKPHCGLLACMRLKNKNQYYKSPNEFDTSGTIADGVYPVLSRSGGWYRVQTNENFVWVSAAQMMAAKVECDAPTVTEVSEDIIPSALPTDEELELKKNIERYRWQYGFEIGWIQTTSSKPLDSLVTPKPSGTTAVNNDAFDTPFIESVSPGAGWFLGLSLETSLWAQLKAKYSVGYKRKTIDVVARPNPPSTGVVTYDELGTETYTEEFGFVYLNTVIKHEGIRIGGILWQPGLNLGFDYSTDIYTQEFQTAPSKLTIYTKEAGYSTVEVYYGPRLDATFKSFTAGVLVNFNRYDLEPTVVVGYIF